MIYNSADIIPAKLYFKIIETGDISLLSDQETPIEDLYEIWETILDQNDKINPNKEFSKIIDISKRIESLIAKQNAVRLALLALKLKIDSRDKDLIDMIKSFGYRFKYQDIKDKAQSSRQYLIDLSSIESQNKSESIRIKRLEEQLPSFNKSSEDESTFDEVVLSYGVIAGTGFIDTNKITLSQYYALIKVGNNKIKALENGEG